MILPLNKTLDEQGYLLGSKCPAKVCGSEKDYAGWEVVMAFFGHELDQSAPIVATCR